MLDRTLSAGAVEFVVLVFAAAIVVSLHQRWPALLGPTAVATVTQTLWLFLVADTGDAGAIAVGAALFGLLLVAALGLSPS